MPLTSVEIGSYAFSGCSLLQNVNHLSSANTIGEYAFKYCTKLESVELSNEILSIEEGCFYGCEALEEVLLPTFVEKIGSKAFYGCINLKTFIINKTDKMVELENVDAFVNTSAMLKVFVDESLYSLYINDSWNLFQLIKK